MFPRERRIGSGQDIITVLRKGRRCSAPSVTCSFLRKSATLSRVAVIVSTKVSKKAVTRNLLKRRVCAIVEKAILPSGDLVIRLEKTAVSLDFSNLEQSLQQCLKKLT